MIGPVIITPYFVLVIFLQNLYTMSVKISLTVVQNIKSYKNISKNGFLLEKYSDIDDIDDI